MWTLGSFYSFAQQSSYVFKNFTIDEGLSQNSVVSIAQDSLGFMWFATQDGLNRFDGRNFKVFPRSYDDITNPENSRLGKLFVFNNDLWMITRGGRLEVLDLVTEEFVHIRKFADGDLLPAVRSIFVEAKDQIWIGTEHDGLYLVDDNINIVRHFSNDGMGQLNLLSNKINQVFRDSRGALLILSDRGINELKQNRITVVLEGVVVNAITEDYIGNLYAGTQNNGIYYRRWNEKEFWQEDSRGRKIFPSDLSVKSLHIDEKTRLWAGTYGNGLFLFDLRYSETFHFLPSRNDPFSIGFQDILSVCQDNKGRMWMGTDGGGISFYDESFGNFKLLTEQHVPNDVAVEQIRAITTDQEGKVWFGTSGNGYSSFDPVNNKFTPFHLRPFKPGIKNYNRVVALHADDTGDLWIGTHGNGTLLKNRKTGEIKRWFTTDAAREEEKISDNTIFTFLQEGPDAVWAGSRHSGLFLIHKKKGVLKRFFDKSNVQENIRALERINDSILALGYERKGVKLLNINSGQIEDLLPNFFAEELDRVEVKCLYYLNGWLWVGTGGKGIVAINLQSRITKRFTEEDGLPNNMIYGILEEDSRSVWASTNKGLIRLTYKKEEEGHLDIDKISSFNRSNGLQSNEFNTGAFHKGRNGLLFFGGVKGLNYFDPATISDQREEVHIVISEARVDNIPFKGKKSIIYEDRLRLKYRENSIAVNYQAINFISPERLNYTYKLEGYDQNWIEAGSRNYTAYTNLPPGDYVFQVKLADNIIDQAPVTSLGISVATPYWQAWWFRILIVLFIFGLLYGIYRARISQILELQKVKDSISADLHDDLGSRLTTIHLLSALTRKKFSKDPDLAKVLNNIDREIYASSEALDEIVWNIRITDESLVDTIAKIRRYSSEALESADIAYSIETSENFKLYKLSMQKRRELFLICKELVNNIRKHSRASSVDFKIGTDRRMLYVSVLDNGKGFDPGQKTHRNGISNLKKRVERWKGKMLITSEPEKGCLIEIWIPFDKRNFFQRIFKRKKTHP